MRLSGKRKGREAIPRGGVAVQRPVGIIICELGLEISVCVYVCEMLVFGAEGGSRRIPIMKAFLRKPGLWKVERPFEGVKLKGNVVRS